MRKRLELVGQTFGNWTVLKRGAKHGFKQSFFICRCTCGRESLVKGADLTRGRTTRCVPCSLQSRGGQSLRDHTGKTIDGWYIIGRDMSPRESNNTNVRWLGRHRCGVERTIWTEVLRVAKPQLRCWVCRPPVQPDAKNAPKH